MVDLQIPIAAEQIESLELLDVVNLSGIVVTARDTAHKYLIDEFVEPGEPAAEEKATFETVSKLLAGGVIYHCGPVVSQTDGTWRFIAAGRTTSIREEPYEHRVIGELGVKAVIGKGGMFDKTLAACQEHGAVYLHAVGGAASLIAERVVEVEDVYKTEFGLPEAFWRIRVEDFQCVVTMDSHGGSLHKEVLAASQERYKEIMGG